VFHSIPAAVTARMQVLERQDGGDRADGTAHADRLRQVPRDTGKLLALMAAGAPAGRLVEIGTSAGYSALWITLSGRPLLTFEVSQSKASLARQTFAMTGTSHLVDLVVADARTRLPSMDGIGFCFLDAEKQVYLECYELVVPRMVPGGLLLADNAIDQKDALQAFLDRAMNDPRVDSVLLPVGQGVVVSRRL
jgi:caffeoyl-CoA O-methyltransferase